MFFTKICDNRYMKFAINDIVFHCRNGLSTIISSTMIGDNEYFLIRANKENSETIYVPVSRADYIIRNVMTSEECDALIASLKGSKKEFNPNTKQRRDAYKRRLNSGSIDDLAYLMIQKILFDDNPDGVKLGAVDKDMLDHAANLLFEEFAMVYKKELSEIPNLVRNMIK